MGELIISEHLTELVSCIYFVLYDYSLPVLVLKHQINSATFCIIFRNIAYIILNIHFGRFCIKLKRNSLSPYNIVNEI